MTAGTNLSQEVQEELARRIATGDLAAGAQLPAEPTLAAELGVSRATLREALKSLEVEGTLTRTPGAGTFVSTRPRLSNNLDANFGVTDAIVAAGMRPGTVDARVAQVTATRDEARRLGLEAGTPVIAVERVRTADGRRVVYSRDVMSAGLADGRPDLGRRCAEGSVYDALERYVGVAIHHGVASVRPVAATPAMAARLDTRRGALLLYLRQVDYDERGQPVLYSHEYHLADAFEITVVRKGPRRRGKL